MITGGTGSFGQEVLRAFLPAGLKEIRIFSRDEKKQDDLRRALQEQYPQYAGKVRFIIGDVRNLSSLQDAMKNVSYVFHAAALKQIPSSEFFPMEAVRTNIIGTDHVLRAACEACAERVVCLSTDKAVYPVNAMGMSKGLMEKVIMARALQEDPDHGTVICCVRYGNVMGSRGSVIPVFIGQIRAGRPVTVTDPVMTRFLMSLEEAVELVKYAFVYGHPGDIFVPKAEAAAMGDLARAVQMLFGDTGIRFVGIRHAEKMDETLISREELGRVEDLGAYFRIRADGRNLNYMQKETVCSSADGKKTWSVQEESGNENSGNAGTAGLAGGFTSRSTRQLTAEEIVQKLLETSFIREEKEKEGR